MVTSSHSSVPAILLKDPSILEKSWRITDMRMSKYDEGPIIGFLSHGESRTAFKDLRRKQVPDAIGRRPACSAVPRGSS